MVIISQDGKKIINFDCTKVVRIAKSQQNTFILKADEEIIGIFELEIDVNKVMSTLLQCILLGNDSIAIPRMP